MNCTDNCFPAPYWILELGPINKDGLYDYAIVSDNIGLFLFVLARNVTEFNELYDAEVQVTLTELGFVGPLAPIPTNQSADCIYNADRSNDDVVESQSSTDSTDTMWNSTIISLVSIFGFIAVGLGVALLFWSRHKWINVKENPGRASLLEIGSRKSAANIV